MNAKTWLGHALGGDDRWPGVVAVGRLAIPKAQINRAAARPIKIVQNTDTFEI